MQLKHSHIFRQEALERLSSPEQLDQAIQVVKPQAWLTLVATVYTQVLKTLTFLVPSLRLGMHSLSL
ncbi:hypothetical protein IQ229_18115 [Nostoc cf. edaphicum LEGE 07299]|uniref:Transposase n=1 Tax=Nostoc cf. edaphicum LEGE 07299 TaxID=2777974 RepID=A0ABR9U290_9NOSO|nr:hypothetical protein [Nostoc edaphicum]MBE9106776.1 hypothetical protein [Nostoc cf. edaphicum LEGE 07299]